MKDRKTTSEVWIEPRPTKIDHFQITADVDGLERFFKIENCCLSCGALNVDEKTHKCERQAA